MTNTIEEINLLACKSCHEPIILDTINKKLEIGTTVECETCGAEHKVVYINPKDPKKIKIVLASDSKVK